MVASAQSGGVLPDVPDLDNSVTVPVGRCGLLVRACALGGHQGGVWNRDLLRCRGHGCERFFHPVSPYRFPAPPLRASTTTNPTSRIRVTAKVAHGSLAITGEVDRVV